MHTLRAILALALAPGRLVVTPAGGQAAAQQNYPRPPLHLRSLVPMPCPGTCLRWTRGSEPAIPRGTVPTDAPEPQGAADQPEVEPNSKRPADRTLWCMRHEWRSSASRGPRPTRDPCSARTPWPSRVSDPRSSSWRCRRMCEFVCAGNNREVFAVVNGGKNPGRFVAALKSVLSTVENTSRWPRCYLTVGDSPRNASGQASRTSQGMPRDQQEASAYASFTVHRVPRS